MFVRLLIVIFVLNFKQVYSFEILTALGGIGVAVMYAAKDYSYCYFKECCNKAYIPADFKKLEDALNEKVYGQHMAKQAVVNALKSHWDSPYAQKPLTLSFHGWPGSGKNYITKFILDSLYKNGGKSKFVHQFVGRLHFPRDDEALLYKENLYQWIKGNVTNCPYQTFIFDEVDKMPPVVLDGIKPIIDYHESLEKVDYRKSVFIFLSNTGATLVNEQYLKMWKDGIRREDIKLTDYEKLIAQGAFNEKGGFYRSDTIKSNLIDHYIPFLPMEREHVKACIYDQFKLRNVSNPSEDSIAEVMDHIDWYPPQEELLSTTGCKRLSQKVALVVQKDYRN